MSKTPGTVAVLFCCPLGSRPSVRCQTERRSFYANSHPSPCPAHPMQYATQNKSTLSTPQSYIQRTTMHPQTENALRGSYRSMMVRKRRHKIDTLRPMSVTTRPRSRRKRTIHAHTSCATISSSGRAMALSIRIEIFSAPASISIRCVVPAPIALRRGIRVRPIRVRVPGRRARSGGRGLRARERDVVPHPTAGPIYRAGAALRRGFRLASAGARSRESSRKLTERCQGRAGSRIRICLWGRGRVGWRLVGLGVRVRVEVGTWS
jgi:hypothetical protein